MFKKVCEIVVVVIVDGDREIGCFSSRQNSLVSVFVGFSRDEKTAVG